MAPNLQDPAVTGEGLVQIELAKARRYLRAFDPHISVEESLRRVYGDADFDHEDASMAKPLRDNPKALKNADGAVQAALRISVDSYNSRQHAGANHFKGVVEYIKGEVAADRMAALRSKMQGVRAMLSGGGDLIAGLQPELNIVKSSQIEARIAEAAEDRGRLEELVREQQGIVGDLESQVAKLSGELQEAREIGDEARAAKETLEDEGVDLTSPNGLAEFNQSYREEADRYRMAVMEAQKLEFGTIDNAALEYEADPSTGRYKPILPESELEYVRGLRHYQQDLDEAQGRLDGLQAAVSEASASEQNLSEIQSRFEAREASANESLAAIVAQIEGTAEDDGGDDGEEEGADDLPCGEDDGLNKLLCLGDAFEEAAAETATAFADSSKAFNTAANRGRGASSGRSQSREAEAILRQGLVLAARIHEAKANVQLMRGLSGIFNHAEEIESWEDEIETHSDDLQTLIEGCQTKIEGAQRKIGDGSWMVGADMGTSFNLLSLIDVELAAESAEEWYKSAIEPHKDAAFVRDYVEVLNSIQWRLGR
jgi:hypothetical protein